MLYPLMLHLLMLYSDDSRLNSESRAIIAAIEKSVPLLKFDDAIFAAAFSIFALYVKSNRFCAVIMFSLFLFTQSFILLNLTNIFRFHRICYNLLHINFLISID